MQNQYVLYKQDSIDGDSTVLLDPNTLRADGTAALKSVAISKDGTLMAYSVSYSGSDWSTIFLRSIDTWEDIPNVKIEHVKFSSEHEKKIIESTRLCASQEVNN